MKRYTLLLLLFSACAEKVSPERADDPKYLLVEEVRTKGWSGPTTTYARYKYDEQDVVKEIERGEGKTTYRTFPENRGLENKATVEETLPTGAIKYYFTDATGKVLRIKGADEEHWYRYDEENRLVERASHFSSRKDTLHIVYDFSTTAEGLPIDRYGQSSAVRASLGPLRFDYDFYIYSLSEVRMPRPEMPFHFGRLRDTELVKYIDSPVVEGMISEWSYTFVKDAAGRVIEKHGLVGNRFGEVIKYKYAAK